MRQKRKNKIIIFSLLGLLCIMMTGYAAFQTNLKIKGTSGISSNWDIKITSVTESGKEGSAETAKAPSWTNLTACMEANLYEKGDSVEYDVTVENNGTLDAKLESISNNIKSTNEAVKITFSGYKKGEKLFKNSSKIIKVKIEYNPDFTGIPEEGSGEVSIELNYTQAEGGTITPTNNYLLTYDYATNGGSNTTGSEYYASETEEVDLSPIAEKEGYEFIGWNTNKDATEGLESLQMPSEDTMLYAIFKKALTVNYTKNDNITSISKENDICYLYNQNATCEITLPTITAKGYNILGWYKNSEKVGDSNDRYAITESTNLTAKAIDDIKPSTPTITNNSNGNWSTNDVTVTITSTDEGSGIDHYEWYENNAWTERAMTTSDGQGTITYTTNRNETIKFRAVDKAGNTSEEASTTVKIDKSDPTLSIATSKTTKSITIVSTATATSGITKYEFSKDGGSTWTTGSSNTYTFSGLKNNTAYSIKARVTSGVGKQTTSGATSVTTNNIPTPTYSVSGTAPKTVKITFPSGCGSTYTCTYKQNNGTEVKVTNTTASVSFTASGTLVGKVSDGTNNVSSSYSVTINYSFSNTEQTLTSCTATSAITCNYSNLNKTYRTCAPYYYTREVNKIELRCGHGSPIQCRIGNTSSSYDVYYNTSFSYTNSGVFRLAEPPKRLDLSSQWTSGQVSDLYKLIADTIKGNYITLNRSTADTMYYVKTINDSYNTIKFSGTVYESNYYKVTIHTCVAS